MRFTYDASVTFRKKTHHQPTNFDDLLIIGYQSRVFEDDEKALFIDQGRHLINWMGNSALRIDRLIIDPDGSDLLSSSSYNDCNDLLHDSRAA